MNGKQAMIDDLIKELVSVSRDKTLAEEKGDINLHAANQQIQDMAAAMHDQNIKMQNLQSNMRTISHAYNSLRSTKMVQTGVVIKNPRKLKGKINHVVGKGYKEYFISQPQHINKHSDFAATIHLYYTDNWPLFRKKIQAIQSIGLDIFITIPEKNTDFKDSIYADFPEANIFTVPNRGRDVLPFIRVLGILSKYEYQAVLKFHSKKSTHRDDGQEWLVSMLDKLLPANGRVLDQLEDKLRDASTGIIGPAGVYYPLTVNFPANGKHLTSIIGTLYDQYIAQNYLQKFRSDFGFFAGTMFWARIDAISEFANFDEGDFEDEAGQIDATFAHALERAFCLVPEINGLDIFEISEDSVRTRQYTSDNIPDWSEDHDK